MNFIRNKYSAVYIGLLAVYVVLAMTLPTNPEVLARYEISETGAKLLGLTVIIPALVIYLTALYGFVKLREYYLFIKDTKEGEYYQKISKGLMFIAYALPIMAVMNTLASYAKFSSTDIFPVINVLQLYTNLILFGIGVFLFSSGARDLFNSLSKNKKPNFKKGKYIITACLIFIYAWLLALPGNDSGTDNNGIQALPFWIAVITVVIPYVYIWVLGVQATMQLYKYKRDVKGVVYKRAFSNISKGFGIIIAISVIAQFISTLSAQLNRLDLSPLLLIIYALVLVYVVGYGFIAKGSRQLRKIEEA